ncbi:MAG: response regulator [Desulfomonilaceae bacterium]
MNKKDDKFLKKLLAAFRVEAEEHLKAIRDGLLELEKEPAQEIASSIIERTYREAHSLKGASRSVNMIQIETVCQIIESIFDSLKKKRLKVSTELFDVLHQATDTMNDILSGSEDLDIEPVLQQLRRIEASSANGKSQTKSTSGAKNLPEASKPPVTAIQADPHETAVIVAPDLSVKTENTENLPAEKAQSGESTINIPSTEEAAKEPFYHHQIRRGQAETVRISVDKLDPLLRQVEEMVSVKLTAHQRATDLAEIVGTVDEWKKKWNAVSSNGGGFGFTAAGSRKSSQSGKGDVKIAKLAEFLEWNNSWIKQFEDQLRRLAKAADSDARMQGGMVDDLLEGMMNVLMLPCSSVLEAFPKLVRDLARESGKEVNLDVIGAELEIDRRILDEMKDPLIHLVRNCIDHGIELPEDRREYGKPLQGTITIAFSQLSGNQIELLVSDDGTGINRSAVLEAARKRGIVSEQDKFRPDDQDALGLVFRSDVTTSKIVSHVSGRGLGLAIVREKVENLGGSVSVDTVLTKGTTFRILLPVTMSTFRGILVSAAQEWFVIPTASVERVSRIPKGIIRTVGNEDTVEFNGKAIPLVRLRDVLELPNNSDKPEEIKFVPALMLRSGQTVISFGVDAILQEQEVLVKGLGKQLARVRNVAGATVLGSGQLVPIVNVPDLIKSAIKGVRAQTGIPIRIEDSDNGHKTVLVAEDSITSRMLLKNILETAGYEVLTAVDGAEAWSFLKQDNFDLVVSDVDMPRMTGFDLTAKIRGDDDLSEMPVVLVTSLGSQEDRERGIEVGANAYIVKERFDQNHLLETIRRLV